VAVPLPLSWNVTPDGSVPVLVMLVAVGEVVTVNVPALPTRKAVLLALVIAGGPLTVRVKACVVFGSTPLLAVIVIE
jgi:hypothetical protein